MGDPWTVTCPRATYLTFSWLLGGDVGKLHKIRRAFWRKASESDLKRVDAIRIMLPKHYRRGTRIYVRHNIPLYYRDKHTRYGGFIGKLLREYKYRRANGLLGEVANRGHGSGRDQAAPAVTRIVMTMRAVADDSGK